MSALRRLAIARAWGILLSGLMAQPLLAQTVKRPPPIDTVVAQLKKQGFWVGSSHPKPPFQAYKLNADGSLSVGNNMPVYYFDEWGSMLPGCPYQYGSGEFDGRRTAIVRRDKLEGVIDRQGKVLIPLLYQSLARSQHPQGWLFAQLAGRWGAIDSTGRVTVPPKYDELRSFSDGMAPVKLHDKWGFIDLTGTEKIAPTYDYILEQGFHNGFAAVSLNADKDKFAVGFINKQNQPITPFRYSYPFCVNRSNAHFRDWTPYYQFHHGYALIRNNKCEIGAIDTLGREVLPIRFYNVTVTDSVLIGYRRKEKVVVKYKH